MLEKLKSLFDFVGVNDNFNMYEGPGEEYIGAVSDIVLSVRKNYPREDINWSMIHDAGCTFDDSELPHHISSTDEIQTLLTRCETLLDMLGHSPTLVTVSRSSCDDYCPPHQVDMIQSALLTLLKMKFANITEHHCYND